MKRGFRVSIREDTPDNAMHVLDMFMGVWLDNDCVDPYTVKRSFDPESLGTFYDVYPQSREDAMYLKIKGIPSNLKEYITLH